MLACVSRSGSWCVCQIVAMEQQVVIDVDEQRLFAMSVQGFVSQSGGAIFRAACAMRSASDCGGNECDGQLVQWLCAIIGDTMRQLCSIVL